MPTRVISYPEYLWRLFLEKIYSKVPSSFQSKFSYEFSKCKYCGVTYCAYLCRSCGDLKCECEWGCCVTSKKTKRDARQ